MNTSYTCLSPDRSSCDIAAAEHIRSTITYHIQHNQLDLDTETIKRGRPYTLRLTKNSNSYKRALKTRNSDKKLLSKLKTALKIHN